MSIIMHDQQLIANSLSKTFSCDVKHFPLKRFFDICFSIFVISCLSPLFLVIFFIVACSSHGKPIYYQTRVGRGGITFRCYKFRTMYADADARLKEILRNNPVQREEWERNHKLKNDPRVTYIGAFLRATSLDELPQFWNVLKGDLSVVGPRPVVQAEIDKHFGVKAYKVFSIRPGITGLWQISGRSDTTYAERIKLDEKYVDTRSFWGDIKIICLTIPSLLSRRGAY